MKQVGYITPLQVEDINDTNWALLSDLVWNGWKGDTFIVQAGSITDFASTPRLTWIILPRIGKWTKDAVLHDKMCDELNHIYELKKQGIYVKPTFTSVDADAIFRKNVRRSGTDPIRSELLWMGVRIGALRNPARREGWLSTAPRVAADVVLVLAAWFLIIYAIFLVAHL